MVCCTKVPWHKLCHGSTVIVFSLNQLALRKTQLMSNHRIQLVSSNTLNECFVELKIWEDIRTKFLSCRHFLSGCQLEYVRHALRSKITLCAHDSDFEVCKDLEVQLQWYESGCGSCRRHEFRFVSGTGASCGGKRRRPADIGTNLKVLRKLLACTYEVNLDEIRSYHAHLEPIS